MDRLKLFFRRTGQCVQLAGAAIAFPVVILFAKILMHVPFLRKMLQKKLEPVFMESNVRFEDFMTSTWSLRVMKTIFWNIYLNIFKDAKLGGPALDAKVWSSDGCKSHRLLDFMKKGRPLVLNLGSYSCGLFVGKLKRFSAMIQEFGSVADFLLVYIVEAHAVDKWYIKGGRVISSAKTLQDRVSAAELLMRENLACPVVLDDTESDEVCRLYGGMPDRYYILLDGVIVYQGKWGIPNYRPQEVKDWLTAFVAKQTST